MPRKLVVTLEAKQGLEDARLRFTQPGSGSAAREKLRNLRVAAERMLTSPYTYSRSPDHAGCRCIICEGYFFLYEVSPDTESNATAGDVTLLAVYPPGFGRRVRP